MDIEPQELLISTWVTAEASEEKAKTKQIKQTQTQRALFHQKNKRKRVEATKEIINQFTDVSSQRREAACGRHYERLIQNQAKK